MENLIARDKVYAIAGAAMQVHTQPGVGFLEAVCQECLESDSQLSKGDEIRGGRIAQFW